jgi:hypothetical protein
LLAVNSAVDAAAAPPFYIVPTTLPPPPLLLLLLLLTVEAMQPHFEDAGSDTSYGTTMTLAALRSYLGSKGVDSHAWWLDVQSIILQVGRGTVGG